ncbi:MAG: GNAT family N-acetyltransferase [Acidobacteriota bacterium]
MNVVLETATAVLDHARDALGLDRVVAGTVPDNEASIRLLRRLGFRYEGMVPILELSPP